MQITALDTETCLFRPGRKAPPLVCVGVTGALYHWTEAKPVVEDALKDEEVLLVGHNIAYDMSVIGAQWPDLLPVIFDKYEEGLITDTGIREKLSDLAVGQLRGMARVHGEWTKLSYSLEAVAWKRLQVKLEKGTWQMRYGELRDIPICDWPEGAIDYANKDVETTLAVYNAQEEDAHYFEDQYRQTTAEWWIRLMHCWGIRTDLKGVDAFEAQLQAEFDEIKEKLVKAGLMRPNGSRDTKSAKARLQKVFSDVLLTPTGQVSLSAEQCEKSGDELMGAYARVSSLKKQLGTDIPLLRLGTRMPIHSSFETLKESGRTGSEAPNLQNLPVKQGVRECFVPRKGCVFAAADYSQFELRTLSQVCINLGLTSKLGEALNSGKDPHLEVAAIIVGITYDEAQRRNKGGDLCELHALKKKRPKYCKYCDFVAKQKEEVYLARQTGKVASFGFPGGLGFGRLVDFAKKSYNVDLTEEEAGDLKQFWLKSWPEMREFFRWVSDQCEAQMPQVVQMFSGRYRGGVGYTDACNTFFQGLAADAAKAAGFYIARACYTERESPLFGCRIVNFVHDEFIVEAPEEQAPEAAEELARLMVEGASPFLPDVPPLAEPVLMRRWSKKAKEIRDEEGRLVPWDMTG